MTHIYISYFFKDKEFTDRLVADLRAAGVKIWRDVDEIAPSPMPSNWPTAAC